MPWSELLTFPAAKCVPLPFLVSDPHEDDAGGDVPPADGPGAAHLHLTATFSACSPFKPPALIFTAHPFYDFTECLLSFQAAAQTVSHPQRSLSGSHRTDSAAKHVPAAAAARCCSMLQASCAVFVWFPSVARLVTFRSSFHVAEG